MFDGKTPNGLPIVFPRHSLSSMFDACNPRFEYITLIGGFSPSEKYESQLGLLFPIYGKIKNVPNHQPD